MWHVTALLSRCLKLQNTLNNGDKNHQIVKKKRYFNARIRKQTNKDKGAETRADGEQEQEPVMLVGG